MGNINGTISIRFSDAGAVVEFHDRTASVTFAEAKLTPKQVMQFFSGLHVTRCEMEVGKLERVGKKLVLGEIIVELPDYANYKNRKEIAMKLCDEQVKDGEVADSHFGSQNSFFKKDGIEYARASTRKWVDIEDGEEFPD